MKYFFLLLILSLFPIVVFINRDLSLSHNIFRMFETNPHGYNPKLYVVPNSFICKIYKIKKASIPIYFYCWLWYIVIHIASGLVMLLIYVMFYFIQYKYESVFLIFGCVLSIGCGAANVLFLAFWAIDSILVRFRKQKIKTSKEKSVTKRHKKLSSDMSVIESVIFIFNLMVKKDPMKNGENQRKKDRSRKKTGDDQ